MPVKYNRAANYHARWLAPANSLNRRKLVLRGIAVLAIVLASLLMYLLVASSLYVTIPAIVPFLSPVPHYQNHWTYTRPRALHHPQGSLYKAAFVTLIQGDEEIGMLRRTMRDLEDSFNAAHGYPYIIFSVEEPSMRSKELVAALTASGGGNVIFETLRPSLSKPAADGDTVYYGYDAKTDRSRAARARRELKDKVAHGDSEAFRFSARFMAGLIFRHPALQDLDYYWRFEPNTQYPCPMFNKLDPFRYMYDHNKKLSFAMSVYEPADAVPTLFDSVAQYLDEHPQIKTSAVAHSGRSLWPWLVADDGQYTRCQFLSSFQVADLSFFRSEQYQSFFDHINKANGIFYERWSDSAIQSLGAAVFLDKQDIHRWEDIGYRAADFSIHCPTNRDLWPQCTCRPDRNFDYDTQSCLPLLDRINA